MLLWQPLAFAKKPTDPFQLCLFAHVSNTTGVSELHLVNDNNDELRPAKYEFSISFGGTTEHFITPLGAEGELGFTLESGNIAVTIDPTLRVQLESIETIQLSPNELKSLSSQSVGKLLRMVLANTIRQKRALLKLSESINPIVGEWLESLASTLGVVKNEKAFNDQVVEDATRSILDEASKKVNLTLPYAVSSQQGRGLVQGRVIQSRRNFEQFLYIFSQENVTAINKKGMQFKSNCPSDLKKVDVDMEHRESGPDGEIIRVWTEIKAGQAIRYINETYVQSKLIPQLHRLHRLRNLVDPEIILRLYVKQGMAQEVADQLCQDYPIEIISGEREENRLLCSGTKKIREYQSLQEGRP